MRYRFVSGRFLGAALAAGALAGCDGGGGPAGADTETGTDTGAGGDAGCDPTPGSADGPEFDQTNSRIALAGDDTYLELSGAIFDGPAIAFHAEADRSGACRLLTYEESICEPACEGGEACVDGACAAYPGTVSAGVLTLLGVADDPVEVGPGSEGTYAWSAWDTGMADVSSLRVEASGGDVGAFALEACAAGPPSAIGDWSAAMEARGPGEDVTLAWEDPVDTARIYLRMTTGIGTHGGISPVEVECEGGDEGQLTLPGAFLDLLYEPAYWGCGECGDNRLFRYHAAEVAVGGRTVQLRVQSALAFYFRP